jgi:hypothetical protein
VGNTGQKSVLCLEIREIPQQIEGYSFNYKIKYRVSGPKTQIFESVYYGNFLTKKFRAVSIKSARIRPKEEEKKNQQE